jgi:hypothetical protein
MFVCISYEVESESSWIVIVVTASVKEDERGGQGHTSASHCISHHLTLHCEHALFLHERFQTSGFVLSAMGGKMEKCVCMKFCLKLGKSATETPEMLCEPLEENSLS